MVSISYSLDVVICSKDREGLCIEQIDRVKKFIPYNKLIVADSSEKKYSIDSDDIIHIHTPNWRLGVVRTMTYEMCDSYLFMSLDDDIVFNENTYGYLLECLFSDEKNVAVSGQVINGYPSYKTIMKLYESGRKVGYAMGISLFIKYKMDSLGGFIGDIHKGEDIILAHIIRKNGYNWNKCNKAKVYHYINGWKHEIKRNFYNSGCIIDLWKRGGINPLYRILYSFGRLILMPFYYMFKTRDVKVYFLYFLVSLSKLIGYIYNMIIGFNRWLE